jgi:Domain of unknown function (DUF4349)
MTMIDEETLRRSLADAADEFEVSGEAVANILATAASDEPAPHKNVVPAFVRQPGRPRTFLGVAAVILIVSAIAVPLLRSEPQSPNLSASNTSHELSERAPSGAQNLTVSPGSPAPTQDSTSEKDVTGSGFSGSSALKIESQGTVNLTVARGHIESAFTKLSSLATSLHGMVESSQANSTSTSTSFATGTIVLEVPQPSFAQFVAEVERVGHATSVTTSSTNVTSQSVDLQARITALNASLAQYLKIMTKATTISGILAVQDQINTIQSEIEQDQSQLKVLTNQTTYASLSVDVSEPSHHVSSKRSGFDKAWHDSLHGFVAGFEWLVRLAGPALFALLMLGALYEIVKYGRRALRRRRI